jgi:hypothetical protein
MSDSNKLIRNVAVDIIGVITIWGLINSSSFPYNFYINVDNKYFNYNININYRKILIFTGISTSFFLLRKYY